MKRLLVLLIVLCGCAAAHAQSPAPEIKVDANIDFFKLPPDCTSVKCPA